MNLFSIEIGPFAVEVPEDWDLVDYPDPRVVVIREPIAPDDPVAAIPGFVTPTIVLRYFEGAAADGGVIRAALREADAALVQSPGSVILAVSPFVTVTGLPGRGHVISGDQAGIPYMASRWFVGDSRWILEIGVTGPATPIPELMELGQHIAVNVASRTETSKEPAGDLQGCIPSGLDDPVMMRALAGDAPEEQLPLESIASLYEVQAQRRRSVHGAALSPEAWAELVALSQGGVRGRLGNDAVQPPSSALVEAGLVQGGNLTSEGAALTTLSEKTPSLILRGRRGGEERQAEVRTDGLESLVTADQPFAVSQAQAESSTSTQRLYSAMSTLGVPTALLQWSDVRADWFADVAFEASSDSLTSHLRLTRESLDKMDGPAGDLVREMTEQPSTLWTAELPDGQTQLAWVQPAGRGPMAVSPEPEGSVATLQSTTGLLLHEILSTLIRDIARSEGDGPSAHAG